MPLIHQPGAKLDSMIMRGIHYAAIVLLMNYACAEEAKQIEFPKLRELAAKDDLGAQWILASIALTKKDYVVAEAWYRKSASKGFQFSGSMMQLLYSNGWGVKKDFREAARWWSLGII